MIPPREAVRRKRVRGGGGERSRQGGTGVRGGTNDYLARVGRAKGSDGARRDGKSRSCVFWRLEVRCWRLETEATTGRATTGARGTPRAQQAAPLRKARAESGLRSGHPEGREVEEAKEAKEAEAEKP